MPDLANNHDPRLRCRVQTLNDGERRFLKGLFETSEESRKFQEPPNGRRLWSTSLQVDVEVPVLAKHAGNVGEQFASVLNEPFTLGTQLFLDV